MRYEITKVGAYINHLLLVILQLSNVPICFLSWSASLRSHWSYWKNPRRFRVCCPKAGKWCAWRSFGSNRADPCPRLQSRLSRRLCTCGYVLGVDESEVACRCQVAEVESVGVGMCVDEVIRAIICIIKVHYIIKLSHRNIASQHHSLQIAHSFLPLMRR